MVVVVKMVVSANCVASVVLMRGSRRVLVAAKEGRTIVIVLMTVLVNVVHGNVVVAADGAELDSLETSVDVGAESELDSLVLGSI